jgi:ATP-binding protein involved in chromosome partitioning
MDYLLVDMPPGTGDIQMALARLLPRTEMVIVTTPALAAQKVAVRVADMARRSYLKVLGVVENMSTFACPHCGQHTNIFGTTGGRRLAEEYGAPLLAQQGVLVAWKGARDQSEERRGQQAAAQVGLALEEVRRVHPFEGAERRHLYVLRKVGETPARFPRRPGMAAKRPLGKE